MKESVADRRSSVSFRRLARLRSATPVFLNTVVPALTSITRQLTTLRGKAIKPLLNLAVAAVIAQSAALPAWGEHLLSCGFTTALRTLKSAEKSKAAAEKHRAHLRAFLPQDII